MRFGAHLPLKIGLIPGFSLTDREIAEMWDLRGRIFRLKPGGETKDRGSFARRVRMGQQTVRFRDPAQVLRGFLSLHWRPSPDGRRLWLLPEYGFLDRDYRGHPALTVGSARAALPALLEARGREIWLAGIGYPRSFQTIQRTLGPIAMLADVDLPAGAAEVLAYLHETFAGETWDRRTHRVWMPTIPEPGPNAERKSAIWQRFEAVCPEWEKGFGLGLAVRLRRDLPLRLARDLLARQRRRTDRFWSRDG